MFNPLGCKCGYFIIYQKYFVCTVTCVSFILLYGARFSLLSCISYIIYITKPPPEPKQSGEACVNGIFRNYQERMLAEVYIEWSQSEKYYVFSAFYIGFILLPLPSGVVCDLYGAKYVLSSSLLVCGLICIAIPLTLTTTPWYVSAILQGLMGLFQGSAVPAMISLVSQWIPKRNRTFLISYAYSGGCLGNILVSLVSKYVKTRNKHWEGLFYFWAGCIFIWFIVIMVFVYSSPQRHPFVDPSEKSLLVKQIGVHMPTKIPWSCILRDSAMWALFVGQLGHSYCIYTIDTQLSEFFEHILKFNIESNLYLFLLPNMCQWCAIIISGYVGELLIQKKVVPAIYMRCIYLAIGNSLASFAILLTTSMRCNGTLILICITSAMIFKGTIYAGLKANLLDITKHYCGVLTGIQIEVTAVLGIIIPQINTMMCPNQTIKEWNYVFWLTFLICTFTSVFYCIFCKSDRARWDVLDEETERASHRTNILHNKK